MSKRLLILPLLVLILLSLAIPCYPVSSAGWLSGWKYRIPITISNSGGALSNYQIQITVDTASLISPGKMRSDAGDIRFTDSDGTTLLPYYIESGINTASTKIWVKVPSIPASSSKTIYMYYGNPSATSQSNGDSVFLLFDDFSGTSLNTNKWSSLLSVTVGNGYVSIAGTSSAAAGLNSASSSYPLPFIEEFAWRFSNVGTGHHRAGIWTTGNQVTHGYSSTTSYEYRKYTSSTWTTYQSLTRSPPSSFTTVKIIWKGGYSAYFENGTQVNTVTTQDLFADGTSVGISFFADGGATGYSCTIDIDWVRLRKYASPEPTTSVGAEQVIPPPTVSAYSAAYTYQYGGKYNISADVSNTASAVKFYRTVNETFDYNVSLNSTCNRYTKTYTDLPPGTYTITVYGDNVGGSSSSSAALTINKAAPSLSLSITNDTWINGASITASETNKGDNDIQYTVYLCDSSGYCTALGGIGTYSVKNKPSGIYTVKLTSSGGQNYSASSMTKSLEVKQAWEKTDSVYANKSYRYDYDKSAIPIVASYKFVPANTTVYVNRYLYVYSSSVNVTNNDAILHQTFTNVIVNDSIPSGFISVNASSFSVSSLSFGQSYAPQRKVYAKSVCAYEKARLIDVGHAVYTISVNSSFVKDLPVVYVLPEPPNWSQRISYSITVDNKTSGFSFDPDTLTLNISTSFSQSSLEVGDHTVDLTYSLATPDLTVKSIKTGSLIEGQETTVNVTIANVGGADVTQQFKVYLYANSSAVGSTTVASLAAHAETLVSFKWTPSSAGSYTLQAVVDPDNVIKEANEANNQLSTTVVVAEATSSNATSGGAPSGGTSGGAPSQPSGGAPSGGTSGGISLPSLPSAIPSGPALGIPLPILLAIPVILIILILLLRRRSKIRATWLKK